MTDNIFVTVRDEYGTTKISLCSQFQEVFDNYKPFKINKKDQVVCSSGKLINLLTKHSVKKWRQIHPGKNFAIENMQSCPKLPWVMKPGVYRIPLGGRKGWGLSAIYDERYGTFVTSNSWHLSHGYARCSEGVMHRMIMQKETNKDLDGLVVDHINGNRLDNRVANLRVVTSKGNAKNRSNDPKYEKLLGVKKYGSEYYTVHKGIKIYKNQDPRLCALCYDSVVTYCYGPGSRINDNVSKEPIDIAKWNLTDYVMKKLDKLRDKHTDFEGVTNYRGKWKCTIKLELGIYDDEEHAAKVRDAAVRYFNTDHKLNFPEEELPPSYIENMFEN